MSEKIRLQKFLSNNGVASRRKAEEMIISKKIFVNGKIAELGEKVDPLKDVIKIGEKILKNKKGKKCYLALNKPRGYVTTMNDEFSRKCIVDLTKNIDTRVFPIGRLDKDSEGLIFLTNDGEFANFVMHPSNEIEKKYIVTVTPQVNISVLGILKKGVFFCGEKLSLKDIRIIREDAIKNTSILEVILKEGKNRHIRKMCAAVNLKVLKLKRVAIGNVGLKNLKSGKYRGLTEEELDYFLKKMKN